MMQDFSKDWQPTEKRLRANIERHWQIASKIPAIVYQLKVNKDGSFSFPFISEGVRKIFGFTPEEVSRDPELFLKSAMKGTQYSVERMIQVAQQTHQTLSFKLKIAIKDGETKWIHNTANPEVFGNGDIIWNGVIIDITEQVKAQEALRESENKFRSLVNNIKLGIFRSTPEGKGKFLEVNPAMEEITGYSREELLKIDVSSLYVHPDERRKFVDEIIKSKRKTTRELLVRTKQGTQIIVNATDVAETDGSGRIVCIDGILEDITERKRMEEQLKTLYESEKRERQELEEEASARGLFINVLGHELRTPLTPIVSSASLLRDMFKQESPSVQSRLVNNVYNGVEILVKRLDELLDLGRFSRGDVTLRLEQLDTAGFIEAVVSRFQPVIQKKGQKLTLDLVEKLPSIMADPIRLDQVLVNLLSNASKFSPEGGNVTLRARKQADCVLIELQDDGIGISSEEQQRLFQPYHRIEQDRHKFPGLGLGLAISKQIIESHKGRIWVVSQPGQGSTFSFQLPIKS